MKLAKIAMKVFLIYSLVLFSLLQSMNADLDCKSTVRGTEYMGVTAVTVSGKTCQYWTEQFPHKHNRNTTSGYKFPEGTDDDAANYCRNPDNWHEGPWCYTTDPETRWEICDVHLCPSCKSSPKGAEYMGTKSMTKSGKQCQEWRSQEPHTHKMNTAGGHSFPDGDEHDALNYCRNPDNWANGPWCYTTDPNSRWEECDVNFCAICKRTKMGKEYMGNVAVTKTGKKCQPWAAQTPHKHTRNTAGGYKFPDGSDAAAGNFCRNPDNWPEGPWCYTTDPNSRWELCDVPSCGCKTTIMGTEYKGKLDVTVTGRNCQAWASQTPHKHTRNTAGGHKFPDGSDKAAVNYCRNPDNWPEGPWCYTTDPNSRWELCDVPACECKSTVLGKEYIGKVAVTKTGKKCQAWASQSPHKHNRNTAGGYKFPDGSDAAAANFCRNPDDWKEGPWCYTTDPDSRWEICAVPAC